MTDTRPLQQATRDPDPHIAGAMLPAVRPAAPQVTPRRRRRWPWVLAGVAALVAAGGLYLQPWVPAPIPVAVEAVVAGPVTRLLAVNGRLAAQHSVDLRAQVSGQLIEVRVTEGERVTAGHVVARIDSAAQQAVVRQAIAALDAALIAQDQAEGSYARALALGANISPVALDTERRATQTARQDVARMTAQLDQAQLHLDRHMLRAPIAGTVLTLIAEPGQTVDPATVLMTLADLDDPVVETDIDEGYAGQIAPGQSALLRLAGSDVTLPGQVRTVAGRVDAATGGLAVTIGLDSPVRAPVGLTVTANIVVESRDAALTVPRTALVGGQGDLAVFVVRDEVAYRVPVAVIDWPAARLIVTDGLAAGAMIVLDASGLSDAQPVRIEGR